ncbi:MAG: GTPase Era [Bulleidia sp.]
MRSGFVALAGRANAGKSTLINALVKQKIAIVSDKPQTTRTEIRGIVNRRDGQIIFTDTPGIHKSNNRLEERMFQKTGNVLMGTDLIYLVVDGTEAFGRGDAYVLRMVQNAGVPVFLLFNKIDRLPKEKVLENLLSWQKRYSFAEFFPISALEQTDFDDLLDTTMRYLPQGEILYPQTTVTDQTEDFQIAEIVREKILYCTRQEVPHASGVLIERRRTEEDGVLHIDVLVLVEREGQKGILIGKNGAMLARINAQAGREIERRLRKKVALHIFVRVEDEWRNKDRMIESFGYGQFDE